MIARTTRTVFEIAAASFLGVILLASVAAWRLAQGPVPLDFLTEHLERALNGPGSPFHITMGGTNLAWAGWQRTLDIRVVDVRATGEDGRVIARVPEMSVSMSLAALLRGVIAPRSLDLIGASVRLVRQKDGAFAFTLGEPGEEAADEVRSELFRKMIGILDSTPDSGRPATYLRRISVLDGKLTIDDRLAGVVWGAPRADIVLLREKGEIRGTFFAELDIGGAPTKINGAASWRPNSDSVRVEAELAGVPIDRVAAKLPALRDAEKIRLDVGGEVALNMSLDGAIRTARFDLAAGKGSVAVPGVMSEALPLTSARLRGTLDGETRRLEIERFQADLGGPKLSARLSAIGLDEGETVNGNLMLDRISLSDLDRYWPATLSPRARHWILANMPSGTAEDIRAALSLTVPEGTGEKARLNAVTGTLRLRHAEIRYLKGLPPVRGVDATAVFSRDRFIATVQDGATEGLRVTSGTVRLTQLETDNEQGYVNVSIDGPLTKALALVDRPPLGFVSRYGLRPSTVEGSATTRLTVSFPVNRNLSLNEVSIAAASRIRDARVPDMAFGQTISASSLSLKVDKTGLELSGPAKIGDVPATVKWTEKFGTKGKSEQSYEAEAVLSDAQRSSLGLPDTRPYVTGPVAVDIAIQQSGKGPRNIALKLALKDASLRLPGFDWHKKPGVDGIAWLSLQMAADGQLAVKDFNLRTPELAASGNGSFDRDRKLAGLTVTNFALGRTKFVATVSPRPAGGYNVDVSGPMFDATPFLKEEQRDDEALPDLPPVDLHANFDRVWLSKKARLDRLSAHLVGAGSDWRRADITGIVGAKQQVTFAYDDRQDRENISIRSNDAGEIFRALGILDTMQGGRLFLSVDKAKGGDARPWKGNLRITDFVLVKAPLLAHILTGASLTGIVDTLSGKGIHFAKLDVPLEIRDGIATIRNARTVGSELGFTADGRIDTKAETISLSGTIVPAYTLNSLLGNIPILGDILTGKKGSGVFAATYRVDGPMKDPRVSVNPLAALAPGFLRNLLGLFEGKAKPEAPKPGAPGAAPN